MKLQNWLIKLIISGSTSNTYTCSVDIAQNDCARKAPATEQPQVVIILMIMGLSIGGEPADDMIVQVMSCRIVRVK
jgi:hypothetical protein